ncbi:MAG: plasmid pRiA4b ORF-3 family protein [Candidatus Taylorbacteria bacterium]|nr:plasmid pRiA4b ORF-3 family protein [Candidatus Taylorbacteria bacterium]
MKSDNILQFKITLNGSLPKIWRRILVPADYTFFDLHCAIQNAMGWDDCHLHAFQFKDKKGIRDFINIATPMVDDNMYGDRIIDERLTLICDYFGKVSKQCVYDYDFGDGWEHSVVLEKTMPKENGKYPRCIAGANACPPDDCGGIWGYIELIKAIKNSKHPDHADMMDWLCIDSPDEFDPTKFDPDAVKFIDPKKRLVGWNKSFGTPASHKKK